VRNQRYTGERNTDPEKDFIMKKIKILWSLMVGNRLLYVFSITAIGISTFLSFIWPVILRVTIDSIIGDKPLNVMGWMTPMIERSYNFVGGKSVLLGNLWIIVLSLIILTALRGIFLFFKGKWSAEASESIAKNLREKLYDHLQKLPFSYHAKVKTGDLVQRCTSDVETIRRFISVQFVEIGRAIFMIVFALSFMIPMNKNMTLVSMVTIPAIVTFAYVFFRKVKSAFQKSDEAEGYLSAVLQENLTGVKVVKAFAKQSFEIDKFDKKNSAHRDLTYHLIWLLALYWSISDLICFIQIGAVLIFGTYWAVQGTISLGILLAFSSYVGMLLWPVRQMGRVLTDMGMLSKLPETETNS